MPSLGIKNGDQVIVLRGKDAGKKGKVMQVFPKQNRLVVEGVNSMTKNVRAQTGKASDKGQRVQFFAPVDRSNVMLLDPASGQPTRLGATVINEKKVRHASKSKQPFSTTTL